MHSTMHITAELKPYWHTCLDQAMAYFEHGLDFILTVKTETECILS